MPHAIPTVPAAPHDAFDGFRRGVIYQVFPDRFARDAEVPTDRPLAAWTDAPDRDRFQGGNLRGITSRLPYLADLGVGTLYLNPVFRARSNHRYDTEDYFHIDPLLGSDEDLRDLCAQAREHGIGVVLDGVFNHTGREFMRFQQALGGDATARAWYSFYPDGSYQTFGGAEALPKLDYTNPEVLDHVEAVLRHWDGYGIAGWRFDVPYKVADSFWEALFARVADLDSARFVIAEAWHEWGFAERFASLQNYRYGGRIHDYVHRHAADAEDFLLDVARWAGSRHDPSLLANHIDSHDTQRFLRACDGDRRDFLLGFALHMVLPGLPVVYYGTELGLDGANDPDCRRTFPTQPDAQQQATLSVTGALMRLRAGHRSLSHGTLEVLEVKNHAFVGRRVVDGCIVELAVNAGWHEELVASTIAGEWTSLDGVTQLGSAIPAHTFHYRIVDCSCPRG